MRDKFAFTQEERGEAFTQYRGLRWGIIKPVSFALTQEGWGGR